MRQVNRTLELPQTASEDPNVGLEFRYGQKQEEDGTYTKTPLCLLRVTIGDRDHMVRVTLTRDQLTAVESILDAHLTAAQDKVLAGL